MHSTFVFLLLSTAVLVTTADYSLTILHTNDVHARFVEANRFGGSCSSSDAQSGKCFGGVARRATMINQIKSQRSNVLLLDGGDQFQGTLWFYVYKGSAASYFMNKLGYSAMALGNHEFDNGVPGLIPFLENVTFPVLCANVDGSKVPQFSSKVNKSTIFNVNGQNIGVIGYITSETPDVSNPGTDLVFSDEVKAVQAEATRLTNMGIKIIIAVGHAGFTKDKEIADKVVGVDIVVGGHTNTFLYTGTPPSNEIPLDSYPTVINPSYDTNRKVLVVQDFYFGKYLGDLQTVFDDDGEVKSFGGNPILLNSSVAMDPTIKGYVDEFSKAIIAQGKQEIGKTYVFLDGQRTTIRLRESNLGNLFTDAMVHQYLRNPSSTAWNDVGIALCNGGGIRNPIDVTRPPGIVTMEDILTVLPFRNTVDVIELQGIFLRQALELSVRDYNPVDAHGRFLQMSGVRVVYDLSKPPLSRVTKAEVRCTNCTVPVFVPLDDKKFYKMVISSFMANGGDGYTMFRDNRTSLVLTGFLDSDVLVTYFNKLSPISIGIEGRIRFMNETGTSNPPTNQPCINSASVAYLMSNMIILLISIISLLIL
ncbi:5'-nucleotidase [Trichoplax sp. H2]|uniref:5'-nucleotidase n=1 Tax=Trichoplax adhaerens TaxID=10228 RepID=B3S9M9_TRIAD|nr:hypothetical protein TRIADDRAFT_31844 [Trichoplax adhaerens]EDV20502.1 hypothetical protein TRIADDRAFT_31844 [Trichoplax adhaerens]RDD41840.1 5'-nucleotidase [Trichoplax sp. H2]|eukprot:XP_002116928.1 hypothetical protein TRIADDRAFT_31844 [Trichoplax adhaerens]